MIVELIRHGRTTLNDEDRLCGVTDASLSEKGKEELKENKKKNIYPDVEFCYLSTLKRTKQTKDIIYPDKPFIRMAEINENSLGDLEGVEYKKYLIGDNPITRYINHDNDDEAPCGGESYNELLNRVRRTFPTIIKDAREKGFDRIAVIGHGSYYIQFLLLYLNDNRKPIERFFDNGRGIEIEVNINEYELSIKKIRDI